MPQTTGGAGGTKSKKENQQAANTLEQAAGPAKEQQEQEFVDLTPGSAPEGVEFDNSPVADLAPSYGDEDEEFMYGLTDLPNEPIGTTNSTRPIPPKNAYRYLSSLVQAAEDPDAPAELHAFIRILQESLSA